MTEFIHIEGQEVWVHGRHAGFIVEQWFYPAPGVQLSAFDLGEIVKFIPAPTPSFDVIEWCELPDGRRKATVKIQAYTVEPANVGTVFLDGVLYTTENVTRRHDRHRILEITVTAVPATPPPDTRQASFMLDKKSMRQAEGRMHRRPVENDQSDSVSRSMKPSGDL